MPERRSRDEEYRGRGSAGGSSEDRGETIGDPDVLLDVPALNVEELSLESEQVRVKVSFGAELADMVKINVGLETEVDNAKLEVKGVEAQAQLKARLDNVRAIFSQALSTLDNNPDLVQDLIGNLDHTENRAEQPPRRALEESGHEDAPQSGEDDRTEWAESSNDGDSIGARATKAAREKALELDVNLDALEGTGSGGRILVKDVKDAARG